jgi:phage-related holin
MVEGSILIGFSIVVYVGGIIDAVWFTMATSRRAFNRTLKLHVVS